MATTASQLEEAQTPGVTHSVSVVSLTAAMSPVPKACGL